MARSHPEWLLGFANLSGANFGGLGKAYVEVHFPSYNVTEYPDQDLVRAPVLDANGKPVLDGNGVAVTVNTNETALGEPQSFMRSLPTLTCYYNPPFVKGHNPCEIVYQSHDLISLSLPEGEGVGVELRVFVVSNTITQESLPFVFNYAPPTIVRLSDKCVHI